MEKNTFVENLYCDYAPRKQIHGENKAIVAGAMAINTFYRIDKKTEEGIILQMGKPRPGKNVKVIEKSNRWNGGGIKETTDWSIKWYPYFSNLMTEADFANNYFPVTKEAMNKPIIYYYKNSKEFWIN